MNSCSIKAAGRRFANDVVEVFRANGHPGVERRVLHGSRDEGDLLGVVGWCFELKNERRLDIAGALDEARAEAVNAGAPWYAAILKRKGKPARQAYVVMELEQFARYIAGEPPASIEAAVDALAEAGLVDRGDPDDWPTDARACDHRWPDEPSADSMCEYSCGTSYDEWTQS